MGWIQDNVPWIFSGVGVALCAAIFGFFINKRRKKYKPSNITQIQRNNSDSINIQIGQQNSYYSESGDDND
jgi:predicted ferric reductase